MKLLFGLTILLCATQTFGFWGGWGGRERWQHCAKDEKYVLFKGCTKRVEVGQPCGFAAFCVDGAECDAGFCVHCKEDHDDVCEAVDYKSIRKEARQLTNRERKRLLDAMWIMKTTSQTEGRAKYGPNFNSWELMSMEHWGAVTALPCDSAHNGPNFWVWHRVYLRKFEKSLQSINRWIVLPYYDTAADIAKLGLENLQDSDFFSSKWMGSFQGKPEDDYVVDDMYWGKWPVPTWESVEGASPTQRNAYGLFRDGSNPNKAPFVTRFGSNYGVDGRTSPGSAAYNKTTEKAYMKVSLGELDQLIQADGFHPFLHASLGGARGEGPGGISLPPLATTPLPPFPNGVPPGLVDLMNGLELAFIGTNTVNGCYESPPGCTSDSPVEDCMWIIKNITACVTFLGRPNLRHLIGNTHGVVSDMGSLTSTQDPIFWFHHANVDRIYYEWQAAQVKEGNYKITDDFGISEIAVNQCSGRNAGDPLGGVPTNDARVSDLTGVLRNIPADEQPTLLDAATMANIDYTYNTVCESFAEKKRRQGKRLIRGECNAKLSWFN